MVKMFKSYLKPVCYSIVFILFALNTKAQGSFYAIQKSNPRISEIAVRMEDSIKKMLQKRIDTTAFAEIFFRSFKYDGQFEVWIKKTSKDSFVLLKTYKICSLSGVMGPKRAEGDFQVPEGFYMINVFNPNSQYHVSLGVNYPNHSDKYWADFRAGGDIYIHGGCATVGCIPLRDQQIEEVYLLASMAKEFGQDFIPLHIFPVRFNKQVSNNYLNAILAKDPGYKAFIDQIKPGFEFFEKKRRLPKILFNKKGDYIIR
jgi:murein L,D-transpeptidase YafK